MKYTLTSIIVALALNITSAGQTSDKDSDNSGAVFVMTNAADKNEIIAYSRASTGALKGSSFATGGRGSGGLVDPLESQGSLMLSKDHSLLFAVNAGSGNISAFRVSHSTRRL